MDRSRLTQLLFTAFWWITMDRDSHAPFYTYPVVISTFLSRLTRLSKVHLCLDIPRCHEHISVWHMHHHRNQHHPHWKQKEETQRWLNSDEFRAFTHSISSNTLHNRPAWLCLRNFGSRLQKPRICIITIIKQKLCWALVASSLVKSL